jgi:hypothetical protein
MNSQPGYLPDPTVQTGTCRSFIHRLALLCLLLTAAGLFSGCARMKQYSLDSWQGPLPMHDLHYVQNDP